MTHDEMQKLVDAWLTPIFTMGQGANHYLFSQQRRPIHWLCTVTTKSHLNYLTYKTKNHWCSIDAHFQNGAASMWLSLLRIKPANTTFVNGHTRLPHQVPWYKTNNCWPSVDAHFAMGVSTICYHLIWPNISLSVFWLPLYRLHVLSHSALHCSLIIHINISFKIYFKVSANCR